MSRAILVALVILVTAPADAARRFRRVAAVDGVGLIDFSRHPDFTVGTWVRYQVTGSSYQGGQDDYTITILIAGEELWWGEECFWVETNTHHAGHEPFVTATLLSYAAFDDPMASRNFQHYMRKIVDGVDDKGRPRLQLFQRARAELLQRETRRGSFPPARFDTLGTRTVTVPKGTFEAQVVVQSFENAITEPVHSHGTDGDSTAFIRLNDVWTTFYSRRVPLTSLVRRDLEETQWRKAWLHDSTAATPLVVGEQARGEQVLVDFGTGLRSQMLPEDMQRTIRAGRRPSGRR